MSAECLKGSGLILLHLQTGNWFCHLPEARRDLQEQDYPVQMFWKALSVSPWRSSREKPSHMQSDVTPPHPEKESSLHVPSCCRALQQCAGGVCKKRWMQGSGMGGFSSGLVQLCVGSLDGALSSFVLRPADRMKSCPMQGPFLSICYKSVLFTGWIWE